MMMTKEREWSTGICLFVCRHSQPKDRAYERHRRLLVTYFARRTFLGAVSAHDAFLANFMDLRSKQPYLPSLDVTLPPYMI